MTSGSTTSSSGTSSSGTANTTSSQSANNNSDEANKGECLIVARKKNDIALTGFRNLLVLIIVIGYRSCIRFPKVFWVCGQVVRMFAF